MMRCLLLCVSVVLVQADEQAAEPSAAETAKLHRRVRQLAQQQAARHAYQITSMDDDKRADAMAEHFSKWQDMGIHMPIETAHLGVHVLHGHDSHADAIFTAAHSLVEIGFGDDHLDTIDDDHTLYNKVDGIISKLKTIGCTADTERASHILHDLQASDRLRHLGMAVPTDCWGEWPFNHRRGLTSKHFWEPAELPFLQTVIDNYPAIRQELQDFLKTGRRWEDIHMHGNHARRHDLADPPNGWQEQNLMLNGHLQSGRECHWFPKTCEVLGSMPEVMTNAPGAEQDRRNHGLAGVAHIYKLTPGTRIKAHHGPNNQRLTAHLGLQMDESLKPSLRVANETRTWTEGEVTVFSDAFKHEVFWSDEVAASKAGPELSRYILHFTFLHPDLWSRKLKTNL